MSGCLFWSMLMYSLKQIDIIPRRSCNLFTCNIISKSTAAMQGRKICGHLWCNHRPTLPSRLFLSSIQLVCAFLAQGLRFNVTPIRYRWFRINILGAFYYASRSKEECADSSFGARGRWEPQCSHLLCATRIRRRKHIFGGLSLFSCASPGNSGLIIVIFLLPKEFRLTKRLSHILQRDWKTELKNTDNLVNIGGLKIWTYSSNQEALVLCWKLSGSKMTFDECYYFPHHESPLFVSSE